MILIYLIIIGIVAGLILRRLPGAELGLVPAIALGIAGALLGGLFLTLMLATLGLVGGVIGAVIGALVILWLYRSFFGRR